MSANASPAKSKWASRMGGVMRRASTVITMSNAMTPPRTSSEDNSDTASLRRSSSRTSLTQSLFGGGGSKNVDVHAPSPIAESPSREWEATKGESSNKDDAGLGPSPLTKNPSVTPTEPDTSASTSTPAPPPPQETEMDTTAPALVDSSAGNHGAFKDELDDDIPRGGAISDPFASPPPAPQVVTETPQPLAPAAMEESDSYFNKPMVESMKGISTDDLHHSSPAPIPVPQAFYRAVDENSIAPAPAASSYVSPPPSIPVSRAPSVAPAQISRAPSGQPPVPSEPISRASSDYGYVSPPVVEPVSRAPSNQPPPSIPVSHAPSNQAQAQPAPSIPVSRAPQQPPAPANISRAPSKQPTIPTVPVTREPSQAPSIAVVATPIPITQPAPAEVAESFPNPHPEFTLTPASPFEAPAPPAPIVPQVIPQADPYSNPFADPYAGHDIWGGAVTNPGFERSAPVPPIPVPVPVQPAPQPQVEAKKPQPDARVDPWGELPVSTAIIAAGAVGMDRVANLSKESRKSGKPYGNGTPAVAAVPVSREVSQQPQYVAGVGVSNVNREPSIRMPNPHDGATAPATTVGFADPFLHPGPIPGQEQPHHDQGEMAIPRPEPSMSTTVIDHRAHVEDHPTIFMPLPPFQEVASGKYPLSREPQTTERTPLLSSQPEDIKKHSMPVPVPIPIPSYPATIAHVDVSPLAGSSAQPHQTYNQEQGYESKTMSNLAAETHARILTSQLQPRLHSLGWLEYHLPDGMFYYVHPTRKLVTDLNLRRDGVLDRVISWMDEDGREGESVGVFVEGWIVERVDGLPKALGGNKGKTKRPERDPRAMVLERYWVDHHARSVVKDEEVLLPPGRGNGYGNGHGSYNYGYGGVTTGGAPKGKRQSTLGSASASRRSDDDQLDMEYKYWTFMEAHPAHTALPPRAKAEAMDVLTWAWTDRLLPSHRSIPPPFNQEECNELSTLLRSFGADKPDENGIETRIISRILIRVALWRQTYFRPHKALPIDAHLHASNGLIYPNQGRSAFHIIETVAAYLLLGIPYLFAENRNTSSNSRSGAGEEAQMMRNPRSNPMLIVGGVSCIFAAIILSTSVTFLSIPTLSYFSRVSILVSLALATLSLATTGIAILRHKSEMEDSSSSSMTSQGHGFNQERKIITARTLVLSAPLVLLSYSIIAFLVAIIAHTLPTLSFWFTSVVNFIL
ncbi:hypothetical protein BJ165DRAFT_1535259 [Panaeolus papilionaceus]|nr:hypothetical protein BJ165DRAFT_1535259 [Panaeolus papilionaceus]